MQVLTKSISDTAISRKVSTGAIRPTVPNRSQKEDVLTSSNYLRSGFRKNLAFPIMLAAVGLLLASLVLGLGTNLARALGGDDGGICGYSDLMKDAILANNGDSDTEFDCDDEYGGVGPFWGGSKTTGDGPNDLDLMNKGISVFMPGKGELDGFRDGARVDLRGNGLTTADLDVSDALESLEDGTDDASKFVDLGEWRGCRHW